MQVPVVITKETGMPARVLAIDSDQWATLNEAAELVPEFDQVNFKRSVINYINSRCDPFDASIDNAIEVILAARGVSWSRKIPRKRH
jgi:hypothetical protein